MPANRPATPNDHTTGVGCLYVSVPVLRAYLKRWKAEVGAFFDGVGPDSSDGEILAIAAKHPAFEVLPVH